MIIGTARLQMPQNLSALDTASIWSTLSLPISLLKLMEACMDNHPRHSPANKSVIEHGSNGAGPKTYRFGYPLYEHREIKQDGSIVETTIGPSAALTPVILILALLLLLSRQFTSVAEIIRLGFHLL